jgi:hypothetical protein
MEEVVKIYKKRGGCNPLKKMGQILRIYLGFKTYPLDPFEIIFSRSLNFNDSMIRNLFPCFEGSKLISGDICPKSNYFKLISNVSQFVDFKNLPFDLTKDELDSLLLEKPEYIQENHFECNLDRIKCR